ncbi:uncharacterized protein PRCAT00002469001 [Priceomyces carsonii]|uniref:uncharacterized protein n=1 Tax=Priceomyces carsonii TaxID=28549 RepID=UPI002EDA080C|nr:unnamed protein product [Priceomyces carsonii]
MTKKADTYREIASKKLNERNKRFKREWLVPSSKLPKIDESKDVINWIQKSGVLSEREIEITESNAIDIVSRIRKRDWRALEVAEAFCHRSSVAHQLVNCLSEVFFDEALLQAAELDKYQDETGNVKGPLHGLPMSIKDNFNIKGQATTLGMVNFCFNPDVFDEDSVLVEILRDMGVVFYTKTNVPVAMMLPETINHIYGETSNPFNRLLSAGGSSGGEAALLALKGSPLGIGSDIGGSIRIPASFQNLYSLRPSFGRFPTYGCRSGLPGLESVNSVNGPLSTSLETLEFYCKSVIDAKPWDYDPSVINLPWREASVPEKLNIAVLADDGWIRPTPPIRRGILTVVDLLKKDGHDVIDWEADDHLRLSKIITSFFLSDGGKHVMEVLNETGEPLFPYMRLYGTSSELGVSDLWKLQSERKLLQKKYLQRWNETALKTKNGKPIDAIILPVSPFAGNPKGKFHDYVGYTSPFNALDFSAATFPVSRVNQNIDIADASSTNRNETDNNIWRDYNPQESHGGAIALQVVCKRLEEEKVIEILKTIADLVGYS